MIDLESKTQNMKNTYVAKLSEEGLDFLIADLRGQTTDKDFAVARFGLLRVDLLVIDDMIASGDHFIDRVGTFVHDEGEASRATSVGVGFDIYALDITVLTEMFLEFLYASQRGKRKNGLGMLIGDLEITF